MIKRRSGWSTLGVALTLAACTPLPATAAPPDPAATTQVQATPSPEPADATPSNQPASESESESATAAPPDPAKIEAVTELKEDVLYAKLTYPVRRGEPVRAPLGVINVDNAPVRGLVAGVRALGDLEFARRYRNCWYTVNGDADIAWCSFDVVLPADGGLVIAAPMVAAEQHAQADKVRTIPFRWASRRWADARGGLRNVVNHFRAPGATVTRGTGGTLTLQRRRLPTADIRTAGNSIFVELIDGPAATTAASPSPTGSPATTLGSGGGLPVTGSQPARMAGLGGTLLLTGIVAYLIARRRRRTDG